MPHMETSKGRASTSLNIPQSQHIRYIKNVKYLASIFILILVALKDMRFLITTLQSVPLIAIRYSIENSQ